MKLSVTQENLSRALSVVSRIATSRGSLPILANVLLKTSDNQLFIASTNLDVAISEVIGAKISNEGSITVPARLLQDYVSSLPSGTIELKVDGARLEIKTQHHTSTINGAPAEDYPVMPELGTSTTVSMKADVLKQTLQQVLFAASSDDARPVLTGLYLHTHEGRLYAVSTDSYRLAEKRLAKTDQEVSLLLPAQSLQEVLRVLKDDGGDVEIQFDEQQARFVFGSVDFVTRLVDGVYPDYRKLVPERFETSAKLTRADLQEITKVSSLFAREAAGGITMTLSESDGEVSIRSIASQVGENVATARAEVTGDATVTLNSRYVIDALSAFEGANVAINLNGKLDPFVLRDPDNDDYLHLIMPVKS